MTLRSVIIGTGSALPARRVSNEELTKTVDTTDEWIVARTGIRFRHIAGEGETTASLGAEAGALALKAAGLSATDLDLIILATTTPDQTFPASATTIQSILGNRDCIAFDVAAVCSGFLYALCVADSMIKSGAARRALVIGAETMTRLLDWEDRAYCLATGQALWCLKDAKAMQVFCLQNCMRTANIMDCCMLMEVLPPQGLSVNSG
jgi:3-oxoacyl-[acyl-carrier-protein] synthase III